MASLADLLKHIKETGETLSKGYPRARGFADALVSNISKNVPSQADFQSPQAMSQWSQAAALNAPMGGIVSGYGTAQSIGDILNSKYGKLLNADITGDKKGLILNKIIVNPESRNQGIGGSFIDDLITYADEIGQPIRLTAAGDFGGNKSGQMRFYKQHGFIENKGRNKNYEFLENMYRPTLEK